MACCSDIQFRIFSKTTNYNFSQTMILKVHTKITHPFKLENSLKVTQKCYHILWLFSTTWELSLSCQSSAMGSSKVLLVFVSCAISYDMAPNKRCFCYFLNLVLSLLSCKAVFVVSCFPFHHKSKSFKERMLHFGNELIQTLGVTNGQRGE